MKLVRVKDYSHAPPLAPKARSSNAINICVGTEESLEEGEIPKSSVVNVATDPLVDARVDPHADMMLESSDIGAN
ncbi:hypothetical protein ACLOJK_027274 [Asimina triloba]